MRYYNIFEDNKYVNTKYECSNCGCLSYEYETYTYSPKVGKAVESFLYYDKQGDVRRTTLYICPHCGVPQVDIGDIMW